MVAMAELVAGLSGPDNNVAYGCLKQLLMESTGSDAVYSYFDTFVNMLDSDNSYIRTRGLLLIAANARWDDDCKIDEIIDEYLKHIMDDKPITARQCIKALPEIAKQKPDLASDIRRALQNATPGKYKSTMRPLVQKDIAEALGRMNR